MVKSENGKSFQIEKKNKTVAQKEWNEYNNNAWNVTIVFKCDN